MPLDTEQVAAEAAGRVASDQAKQLSSARDYPPVGEWELAVQAPFGAMKPINTPRRELVAVAHALAALEVELVQPVLASDRLTLGSIGRVLLLEHRAFRLSARGIERPSGDVRPVVVEFRQLARLKVDLLARLRFRRGGKNIPSIEAILAEHAEAAERASEPRSHAEAPSPAPANDDASAAIQRAPALPSEGLCQPRPVEQPDPEAVLEQRWAEGLTPDGREEESMNVPLDILLRGGR
jgi:hypothetical protein